MNPFRGTFLKGTQAQHQVSGPIFHGTRKIRGSRFQTWRTLMYSSGATHTPSAYSLHQTQAEQVKDSTWTT